MPFARVLEVAELPRRPRDGAGDRRGARPGAAALGHHRASGFGSSRGVNGGGGGVVVPTTKPKPDEPWTPPGTKALDPLDVEPLDTGRRVPRWVTAEVKGGKAGTLKIIIPPKSLVKAA